MKSRNLKIALSGFSGTGKTSLAKALGHRLELPVIPEEMLTLANADRALVIAQAENRFAELPDAIQALINAFVHWDNGRSEAYAQRQGYIADRWEADLLDWWLARFGKGSYPVDQVTATLFGNFQKKAADLDYVILMPLLRPFSRDANDEGNKRGGSMTTQLLNTTLTRGLIVSFTQLPIISLPSQPLGIDERVDYVLKAIAAHQSRRNSTPPSSSMI